MSYLPWIAGGAALGYAARRGRRAATGLCFPFVLEMAKNSTNEEFFDKSKFQVVHGDVWDLAHSRYTPHAWVEKEGRAFDWQTRTFRPEGWDIQEFRDYYRARNMVTYTAEEVTINCMRTQHKGPWEPHERAKGRGPRTVEPRGEWQREFLRELDEMGYARTFRDIVSQVNSYDDQLTSQVGEGASAQGREHLRKLIRAGTALSKRAPK